MDLTPQIVSAAAYLYELGAVEGPEVRAWHTGGGACITEVVVGWPSDHCTYQTHQVEAPVTSLAPLLNTVGMDLAIVRFMTLGA